MNTTPDPMQEWAGFWLKEQQRCWQHWLQSYNQASAPVDLTVMVAQAWQQGNELWLNSIRATLPVRLVEPIAAMVKQSQQDLHQAFQAGQAQQPKADQSAPPGSAATSPGPWLNSLNTVQDFDPGRLSLDPAWREYIQALNTFIQFHIRMTIESLNTLKTELPSNPGHDPDTFMENHLREVLSDYQARLQSSHYRQVLDRLINSIAVMSSR